MPTPHLVLVLITLSGTPPEASPTVTAPAALMAIDVREVPRSGARPPPPLNTRRLVRKRLEADPRRARQGLVRPDRSICTLAEAGGQDAAERLRADRHCPTRASLSFRLLIAGGAARCLHLPPPADLY